MLPPAPRILRSCFQLASASQCTASHPCAPFATLQPGRVLLDNCPNPHACNGGRSSCRSCQRLSLMYTPPLQRLSQLSRLSSLAYCKSPMTSPRPEGSPGRKAAASSQKKREVTEQVIYHSAASSPRARSQAHVATYPCQYCGHGGRREAYRRSCLSQRCFREILSVQYTNARRTASLIAQCNWLMTPVVRSSGR